MNEKTYTLEIPRNQYDRLGNAFDWEDEWFISFDPKKDTIRFRITEAQRKHLEKFAQKQDDKRVMKKLRTTYWITQMFREENIQAYTMGWIMIPTILRKVRESKHSKLLFKIYICWCVIADITLLGGLVWGAVYLWF